MKRAQIHRFNDCIVAYLGNDQTIYMTPQDARNLAKALNACARDVKNFKYLDGKFRTTILHITDTGHNGVNFKVNRGTK